MDESVEIVVIGGGAMGAAATWALASAGHEVLLLEQHEWGHERGGSHGAGRLFRLDYASPESLEWALGADRLWHEIEVDSGSDLLTRIGSVEHGFGADHVARALDVCRPQGVALEVLSAGEAEERWTGMRFDGQALHQPDSGRIHPGRAVEALLELARQRGATIRDHVRVTSLRVGEDVGSASHVVVTSTAGTVRARSVVVTTGAWTHPLVDGLATLPPITVRQEQPRVFTPHDSETVWPAFVHWREEEGAQGRIEAYGVSEVGADGPAVKVGLHATGPVVDPDHRDYSPDLALDAYLLDYVRRWYPGLDTGRSQLLSCLYDLTPDEQFVIDRAGPVVVAAGFSGTGFKFVPSVGVLIRDLVVGGASTPERFRFRGA